MNNKNPLRIPADEKFGRLTVLHEVGRRGRKRYWVCRCECGTVKEFEGHSLRGGSARSCGCLQTEARSAVGKANKTHGHSKKSEYGIWAKMHRRCYEPSEKSYPCYGGRGITICERWHNLENFLTDMGSRPPGFSIERKDNDLGYSPDNCVWANKATQSRNRRTNRHIRIGEQTRCLYDWLRDLRMSWDTFNARRKKGWTDEMALTAPLSSAKSQPKNEFGQFTWTLPT